MEQAWWLGIVPALIASIVTFVAIRAFSKSTNTMSQFLISLGIGAFFVMGFWVIVMVILFKIVRRVVIGPKQSKKTVKECAH